MNFKEFFFKEDPDEVLNSDGETISDWEDSDAVPFGFVNVHHEALQSIYQHNMSGGKRQSTKIPGNPTFEECDGMLVFGKTYRSTHAQLIISFLEDFGDLDITAEERGTVEYEAREILFPSGRIWDENKIISFWTEEGDVTKQHIEYVFDGLGIPADQQDQYLIEFLNEPYASRTYSDYKSGKRNPKAVPLSPERKAELLAKGHLAAGMEKKDKDLIDLQQQKRKAYFDAKPIAKQIPLNVKQQAQTSESFKG